MTFRLLPEAPGTSATIATPPFWPDRVAVQRTTLDWRWFQASANQSLTSGPFSVCSSSGPSAANAGRRGPEWTDAPILYSGCLRPRRSSWSTRRWKDDGVALHWEVGSAALPRPE